MENPKCPYCGEVMDENDSDRIRLYKVYWYTCDNCGATSPYAKSEEAAYAAAMKRGRTKGEWKVTPTYIKCSECGESFMLIPQNFCPNCGADMGKEDA